MQSRQPFQGLQRKLILAFDVGTTFSGVSYSVLDPGLVPDIKGVTRYPAQEGVGGSSKIPSILYYDQGGAVRAVGAEALQESNIEKAEEEGWIKVEWFKLHLRPDGLLQSHIKDKDLPPLPPNVTPIRAFSDFLRYLYRCARTYIETTHASGAALLESVGDCIEFVLSHPNGWEGAQQNQMRKAAVLAGLIPDSKSGQERLQLVTEGEASLHFCINNGLATDAMRNGQGIVIIDAGGGTIDLSAYYMASNPKSFEEIAPAECRLQGSVFISRRARVYLEDKLRDSRYGGPEDIANLTQCFDKSTKLTFRNANEPSYIRFGTARDKDPAFGIRSGQMKIPGTDIAVLFQPSIDAIIDALSVQRQATEKPITTAFLVGGFAASDWLFFRLQDHLTHLGIEFSRPDSNVNKAVADGAVSFYLDHMVSARAARFTYGMECSIAYDENNTEHRQRASKKYTGCSGSAWIDNAFDTILRKGTKVSEKVEFRRQYFLERNHASSLDLITESILSHRGDDPHPRWTDTERSKFTTVCSITADTSNVVKAARWGIEGRLYYVQDFDVILLFGLTELKAQISWIENGVEKRGDASIVYDRVADTIG